jgi:hypothetical protein
MKDFCDYSNEELCEIAKEELISAKCDDHSKKLKMQAVALQEEWVVVPFEVALNEVTTEFYLELCERFKELMEEGKFDRKPL